MYIEINVPATTSNLGPGFDALGMALSLSSTFICHTTEPPPTLSDTATRPLRVDIEGFGVDSLPRDRDNLVISTLVTALAKAGRGLPDLHLVQRNEIPLGSGLGSSSTAIVGGLAIAQALLGQPLDRDALLLEACKLEGHPDNAVPCVLGGLTTATFDGTRVFAVPLPIAANLGCVVCTPDLQLSTVEMRAALPSEVPFEDAVFNGTHACLLIAALATGRLDLLAEASQDRLHQRHRAAYVPGFKAVITASQRAGALTTVLSGAGPTVIALVDREQNHDAAIGHAMETAFASVQLASVARVLTPRSLGLTAKVSPMRGADQ